ncbi:MAG: hypothetical protein F6K44_27530, partial [Moorea sp. SIO3E2]|nr:hypothetical protein [Moorena sp. SIO3E2]
MANLILNAENAPLRSWGGSAVLGRQRGLGEAARSWGGSAVLGRQRGLGEAARSWGGSAVLG